MFTLARNMMTMILILSPILFVLLIFVVIWKSTIAFRLNALVIASVGVVLGFVDWALLAALPYLQLSFGPIVIPLLAWWTARYVLFIGWLIAHRISVFRMSRMDKMRPALIVAYVLLNLALVPVMVYGFYTEPVKLTVSYHDEISDHDLDRPLRIVHLTDLHIARTGFREEKLLLLVEAQQPDLIVLTGDYLNLSNLDDPFALEDAHNFLAQLNAPLGVYAVSGSVDAPYHMNALFTGLNITVLDNEITQLPTGDGKVYMIGVTTSHRESDAVALASLLDGMPDEAYSILLYHTPDLIEKAEDLGVDLYFAGHTHGGQIRLPFYGALFTSSAYGKRYEMGRYAVGDTILYVSRGIGMEGSIAPRARFLCPPEVVVMDLISPGTLTGTGSKPFFKTVLQVPVKWFFKQTENALRTN